MQEAGFLQALFHLQTLHGAQMPYPGISLSVKSAFQNKSFAHKLTGIIPCWRSKDQLSVPCFFQVEKSIEDGLSDLIFFLTHIKENNFAIAKLK